MLSSKVGSGSSNFTIFKLSALGSSVVSTTPLTRKMSSSDLSELTSNVSSDDEAVIAPVNKGKLEHYFKHGSNAAQATPTLKKKRPPSPPHEYVLADNQDIAVSDRTLSHSLRELARSSMGRRVADIVAHSSLSCSAPASATLSQRPCPTTALRTSRMESSDQYRVNRSKSYCVRCWDWS